MKIKLIIGIFAVLLMTQMFGVVHAQVLDSTGTGYIGGPSEAEIVKTPAGYCVTDIRTHVDAGSNPISYYDKVAKIKNAAGTVENVRIGYPLNFWDVPVGRDSNNIQANGYMNMSAVIDKIESGNCLAEVAFRIAVGNTLPPPTQIGDMPWVFVGSWQGPHVWQPGGNGAGNAIGVLYKRKMDPDTESKVITGLMVKRHGACPNGQGAYNTTKSTDTCIGAWLGEGTTTKNTSSYYDLRVQTTPYTKMGLPTIAKLGGSWEKVVTCNGCGEVKFKVINGVTSGQSIGKETETARSLEISLGATVGTGAAAPVKAESTLTVTGTISESVRNSIVKSFEQQSGTEIEVPCSKGVLWKWVTTVTLSNGVESSATASNFTCTTPDDVPAAKIRDPEWKPKP